MLEKTNKNTFLRLGLSHYPDARETVDYFEDCVEKAIFRSFEAKNSWKTFQPSRDAGGNLQLTKFTGPVDRFICGYLTGTLPNQTSNAEKVWITLGLAWNPRCRPEPVLAYGSGSTVKGSPIPLRDLQDRDRRVSIGPLNKKSERRLLVGPGPDFDPDELFPLLLDALDNAMEVIESGNSTPESSVD